MDRNDELEECITNIFGNNNPDEDVTDAIEVIHDNYNEYDNTSSIKPTTGHNNIMTGPNGDKSVLKLALLNVFDEGRKKDD